MKIIRKYLKEYQFFQSLVEPAKDDCIANIIVEILNYFKKDLSVLLRFSFIYTRLSNKFYNCLVGYQHFNY